MTESELLSHADAWLGSLVDSVTLYLYVLFAYFAAAHLVGRSLSRVQLAIIATVYTVVMASGIVTMHLQINAASHLLAELEAGKSSYVYSLPPGLVPAAVGAYGFAFLASHY